MRLRSPHPRQRRRWNTPGAERRFVSAALRAKAHRTEPQMEQGPSAGRMVWYPHILGRPARKGNLNRVAEDLVESNHA